MQAKFHPAQQDTNATLKLSQCFNVFESQLVLARRITFVVNPPRSPNFAIQATPGPTDALLVYVTM